MKSFSDHWLSKVNGRMSHRWLDRLWEIEFSRYSNVNESKNKSHSTSFRKAGWHKIDRKSCNRIRPMLIRSGSPSDFGSDLRLKISFPPLSIESVFTSLVRLKLLKRAICRQRKVQESSRRRGTSKRFILQENCKNFFLEEQVQISKFNRDRILTIVKNRFKRFACKFATSFKRSFIGHLIWLDLFKELYFASN